MILFIALAMTKVVKGQSNGSLTYLDKGFLDIVQGEIDTQNVYFVNALNSILADANSKLSLAINPVTSKTVIPPSGDMHDYISIGPYWWPDPSKPDGLPWINKDGQINPDTRGDHTDVTRAGSMMGELRSLGIALYFSDDDKYAQKIKQVLHAWFVDPATKMNPNLKYAQAIPGINDGRAIGMIEFGRIDRIINTIQIMEMKNKFLSSELSDIKSWFADYLNWLETSDFGVEESNMTNNHAVWYYRQVIGLNLFLGNEQKAKAYIEDVKTKLIQVQIEPDGSMPRELERTKSIDYTATNIEGFIDIAKMAEKMGVDLWGYSTADGRSIPKTFEFLKPYLNGEKTWQWEDIKHATFQEGFEQEIYPLLAVASRMFNTQIMPVEFGAEEKIGNFEKLTYPPLSFPKIYGDEPPEGYVFASNEKGTVIVTGKVNIAYGANGSYRYLYNQTENVDCNNDSFGGDPIKGVVKKCYTTPVVEEDPIIQVASDNFKIVTIGETCAGKKNGVLEIKANVFRDYSIEFNGKVFDFTTSKTFEGLDVGIYDLCISISGSDFKQCYTVEIDAAVNLSGKVDVTKQNAKISVTKGTAPYMISKNGEELFETYQTEFLVAIVQGDELEVSTSKACEGKIFKRIDLFDGINAYPNPTTGHFELFIPNNLKSISIEVYNIQSQLVSKKVYGVNNGKVKLNLENKPSGVYFVKVNEVNPVFIKVIKQ